jgi:hypothetical protein
MKTLTLLAALVLALPAVALADKSPPPGNPGKPGHPAKNEAGPKVKYVLHGTLTSYTAASGTATGSVSLLVKNANHHAHALVGQTLTFTLTADTRVVPHEGAVTLGDRGTVKLKAPKHLATSADLATQLEALTPKQVVDQGPAG